MKKLLESFKYRKMWLMLADAFIVAISALISNFVFSLLDRGVSRGIIVISILLSIICCSTALFIFGAYSKMWRYYNKNDYRCCVYGVTSGIVASSIISIICAKTIPISYALLQMLLAMLGVCLFRYLFKTTFITLVDSGVKQSKYKKTMIIGGGQACRMLIKEMQNVRNSNNAAETNHSVLFEPVCILDDDKSKIGTKIHNVEIVGTTADMQKFITEKNIEQLIFAIPSCMDEDRKRILDLCSDTKLPVKVIPFLSNLFFDNEKPTLLGQVRDINVEDLLGREPITFDNKDIRNFISGKVCMVTGGGGSIGSELVRQIAKYHPKQIVIVDIYENNAYEIQQELIMEYGDDLNLVTLIASVRDYYRMNQIFERYKPQIVFHAAAHKHVPLMEVSPMEAIKNNVVGTFNTATLAQFHNVEKFVMISTDKAVNPTNVMGASKRCCEMIMQYLSQQKDGRTEFVTTRFGNVLGSNGSVIPLFKKQIEQGKPVTVTHPDIIRYFMTIPEAVSLVMEAAAIAHGGEIFVLDMGQPVKIVSLAENLIRMYGKVPYKDVEIRFTGLRPGEKIKEELLMNEEGLQKTANKLIFIGKQIQIEPEHFIRNLTQLRDAAQKNDEPVAVQALHRMVPTFITPEEFNRREFKDQERKDLVAV